MSQRPWKPNLRAACLSALLVMLLTPVASHAIPIDTSIGRYEVTTVLTGFNEAESLLKSQVWWENVSLAEEFAALVGDAFGTPNLGLYSPFFWVSDMDTTGPCAGIGERYSGVFWDGRAGRVSPVCAASAPVGPFTFAVANPIAVAEPATWALLLLGIIGLCAGRARRPAAALS